MVPLITECIIIAMTFINLEALFRFWLFRNFKAMMTVSINPFLLIKQKLNRGRGESTKSLSVYFPRHVFSLQMKTDSVWGFSACDTCFTQGFRIVGVGRFCLAELNLKEFFFI